MPQWRPNPVPQQGRALGLINIGGKLSFMYRLRQFFAMLCVAALCATATAAFGQSGGKPVEPQKPTAESIIKEGQKKIDEIAEASRVLVGPAGNPECVWLGRRVVSLLWRDDLDTAFRHLDLYDRFACPSAHIQATFRCLVRQGNIDPKAPETLNSRVHACWLNPGLAPTAAVATPAPPAAPAAGTQKP
ncbi:MAG TPA: beta-1-3, beta-1-6-glucan biosynthesis protein [Pseudolabrys sp.]|nr:beta-1-3, beta-1-6-glucan biosynthesis protein [Pseudolabrys sp.]